jgi:hypothetical protein
MHELRGIDMGRMRVALYRSGAPLAVLVFSAGCVAASSAAGPSPSPSVLAPPVASPSPAASGLAALIATPFANSNSTAPTPASPPATIDVSPAQVPGDEVTFSLVMEPARRMLAQTAVIAKDPDPAHQPAAGTPALAPATAVVLDGFLSLTNNIDPSQPAPDDQPQAMVRHVNVQIRMIDGGYAVPYLAVSLDMLLDGHPTLQNLPLMPMVAKESTAQRMYYGNNVKLTQRGSYQVFVRLQPSPVLGKDQPTTAQFNVMVR